jgi:hypothetical protein
VEPLARAGIRVLTVAQFLEALGEEGSAEGGPPGPS